MTMTLWRKVKCELLQYLSFQIRLKVHKKGNFFVFDFEFSTVSLLAMLKYEVFVTNNF
jgi:hypothetical protein